MIGAVLCGLAAAVLYLAYAQENGEEWEEEENGEEQVVAVQGRELPPPAKNGVSPASSVAKPFNGAKPNGNGQAIDLMVGGTQSNLLSAAAAEGTTTNLISISLDGVPVQDVVNMFAQISGANIITAGTFTNVNVTANLKNVEWKTALNLALGSVNLAMIEDPSGILMVVTSEMYKQKIQQIEETKPLVTRTFAPKYLSAVDLAEQIKLLKVLSPRGTIITSQSKDQSLVNLKSSSQPATIQNPSITTAIIVSDIKEYVDKVEALIVQLDRREPQVFIEARIIDVGIASDEKLGFDWGMLEKFGIGTSLQNAQWQFSDGRQQVTTTDNRDYKYDRRSNKDDLNKRYDINAQEYEETTTTYEESPPGSGNWVSRTVITPTRTITDTINRGRELTSDHKDLLTDTFMENKMGTMILSVSDVKLFLSALRQNANADMLSHPVLIVGNRVEAKIHVGEQTWRISLKKTTAGTGVNITENYSEDAAPVDLGLKLWVIPEIDLPADTVRLTIEPEMTVFVENINTAQGSVYPVTSTRRISTRVNCPNSHTVVVGGLVENSKVKREKRVPLLGDVPLLGLLFRHTHDADIKKNLLIMLTPTILDDRKPLTGMEAIAQLTVDKFEKAPLPSVKNVPTNEAFAQSLATNLITPSSGLTSAAQPAPAAAAPAAAVALPPAIGQMLQPLPVQAENPHGYAP